MTGITTIEARITELTALLERQHAALGELDAISRRQRALIEAADGGGLLELLRGRAVLVERAEAGSVRLARLREELGAATLARDTLAALAGRFLELESIAGRIAERDREDEAILKIQRDRVAAELAELAMGRRAVGAYGPSGAAQSPRYQDRNG